MTATRPEIKIPSDAPADQIVVSLPHEGSAPVVGHLPNGSRPLDTGADAHAISSTLADARASRRYMVLFERATGIVGVACLVAGLADWAFQPHSDHRAALVILVFAMFMAILHYYSLEDTRNGDDRAEM